MSALAVYKPSEPQEQTESAKKISAADLLAGATKKGKSSNHLVYTGEAGRFPQIYAGLKGHGAEGVVLKRRKALYSKHIRAGVESRDWLKRRFAWD